MESSKPLNKVSDEELLKILEESGSEKLDITKDITKPRHSEEVLYENDVLIFLSELNLEPGTNRVRSNVFYKLYKMWSKNPVDKFKFYRELSGYIPTVQGCVYLNLDVIKVKSKTIEFYNKKPNRVSRTFKKQHIDEFLKYYKITPGATWVSAQLLGFLYSKWTYDENKYQMAHHNFVAHMEIYFDKRITHNEYVFFAVSNNIKNIVKGVHNEKDWQKEVFSRKKAKRLRTK